MKIPCRWLREFVDTEASPDEMAERLTMAGIETGRVESPATGLSGVVVGEIEDVVPHPAGGPLTVCQVATGGSRHRVVCGAPNVRPRTRAAFAPPGAVLPGGRRIDAATIKGTLSEGMLCSEPELGLGEDGSRILLLPADAPIGAELADYLELDDVLLNVEVTPNRPDCLSVLGIAREVAALTGGRLRPWAAAVVEVDPAAATLASVVIEDAELCPRYAGRVIVNVTVAPSPARLAQRLRAVGLRPINNVVDVTNYVLWELGHPLHAFDHDRLAGHRIVVRRARAGETLATLDGQARALGEAMLAIADAERAVAVAGVMGGANSEVGATTRQVLLESAYFNPGSVRRTAKALGLSTEASYRFERGADIEGLRPALDRAAGLIAQLAGGQVARGVLDAYPAPRSPVHVDLRLDRIRRVLGACPPERAVGEILERLGLPAEAGEGRFRVAVPTFRRDLAIEDDLVEEIARVWGYGEIPSTMPVSRLALARRPAHLTAADAVRRMLVETGFQETVTLSLIDPARLARLGRDPADSRTVVLRNPLASDRSVLRPTLLFGLLETMATNVRRQTTDLRVFEIGRTFEGQGPGQLAREETAVGVAITGFRAPRAWFGDRDRADVFDVKGAIENVVAVLGRDALTIEALEAPCFEEGRGVRVLVEGRAVGVLGELHPGLQRAFDLPAPVFFAELSLDRLEAVPPRPLLHRPLPRFPGVQRDLAVVVPVDVPAEDVSRTIREEPNPALARVVLFDVYAGEQVGAGKKSLAFSLSYQAEDRTLTDGEVNVMHAHVVERLRGVFRAEVRGVDGRGAP